MGEIVMTPAGQFRRVFLLLSLLPFAYLLISASARSDTSADPTIIFLIRHAEKLQSGSDPDLAPIGLERTQVLATNLKDANISAIYATDFKRTRQTVSPLAQILGLPVTSYDPKNLEAFAATLRKTKGRLLIAGHSNTTPKLVALLGGDPGPPIDETKEFDRMYVVTLPAGGTPVTVLMRYCPCDAAGTPK
jgi:phosphohistidine phosphatase SixA